MLSFVTDNYGNTPLHEAIKHSHESVASLLVKSGASLDIIDAGNCLCMAVVREDFDYLRKVMEIGANPNSKNYDLRTPLHLASSKGLYAIAHVLLDAGASVFAKDRYSFLLLSCGKMIHRASPFSFFFNLVLYQYSICHIL